MCNELRAALSQKQFSGLFGLSCSRMAGGSLNQRRCDGSDGQSYHLVPGDVPTGRVHQGHVLTKCLTMLRVAQVHPGCQDHHRTDRRDVPHHCSQG